MLGKVSNPLGAFIDAQSNERLDWVQVQVKATALSTCWTSEYGLESGQTVSVLSGNTIWYPICVLAVARAGARMNGVSAALTVNEIVYALTVAKSKIVVTSLAALGKVRQAATQVGIPWSKIFLIDGQADGVQSIQELIQQGLSLPSRPPYRLPAGTTNKEICGNLNFSSGTTGLPKAVMLSQHNLIAQCLLQRQVQTDAHTMPKLAVLPLYHIIGTWRFCLFPILVNVDCVILPSFSMPSMLKAIVDYQIQELVLVPPIVMRLARDSIVDEYDLRHVKRFTSGAAPISAEVLKSLEERFPWAGFRGAYGATEAPVISGNPESHYAFKYASSVGMLLPSTVVKIIDPQGKELGLNESGEILAKGPQVAMGYLDNEKATMQTFDAEGFLHTGDFGYFDEEGLLFVVDRIKEMIKVKGIQVAPAELEDLLLGLDIVSDCAVIGQPDEYAGELPKAFIVLKSGNLPSNDVVQSIFDHVRENKARFKWLGEVEFVDVIPKSAAGKLLRQKLRDMDRCSSEKVNGTPSSLRMRDTRRF